ncbi:Protein kinase domain-containing protein [Mycena venus]|uniref:Protein kinase domain-containing protein n=1 Tax=Mycena venus TaxID=2733690 RepID=A0A8H7CCY1_9AGAR|nr:Protein kinase domain-containing protein [Mycena venus]
MTRSVSDTQVHHGTSTSIQPDLVPSTDSPIDRSRPWFSIHPNLASYALHTMSNGCNSASKPSLSNALVELSGACDLRPTCFELRNSKKVGDRPVDAGNFGDVWKGVIEGQTQQETLNVSLKIMRVYQKTEIKAAIKEFGCEAVIWRQLSHPNLLPFLGLYYVEDRPCLVSPWIENGDLVQFLRGAPPDTDHTSLILDIAMGLAYLHNENIVHGDLKGKNILVAPSGAACICDFGLSSVVSSIRFTQSKSGGPSGTARWQAPELLSGDSVNHYGSDIYAFGCVCYEILSGKVPLHHLANAAVAVQVVYKGARPKRPEPWRDDEVYNGIWELMEDCWKTDPDARPTAAQIVQRLVDPPIGAKPTKSGMDWDDAFSSRFRHWSQDCPLLLSISEIEAIIFEGDIAEVNINTPIDGQIDLPLQKGEIVARSAA